MARLIFFDTGYGYSKSFTNSYSESAETPGDLGDCGGTDLFYTSSSASFSLSGSSTYAELSFLEDNISGSRAAATNPIYTRSDTAYGGTTTISGGATMALSTIETATRTVGQTTAATEFQDPEWPSFGIFYNKTQTSNATVLSYTSGLTTTTATVSETYTRIATTVGYHFGFVVKSAGVAWEIEGAVEEPFLKRTGPAYVISSPHGGSSLSVTARTGSTLFHSENPLAYQATSNQIASFFDVAPGETCLKPTYYTAMDSSVFPIFTTYGIVSAEPFGNYRRRVINKPAYVDPQADLSSATLYTDYGVPFTGGFTPINLGSIASSGLNVRVSWASTQLVYVPFMFPGTSRGYFYGSNAVYSWLNSSQLACTYSANTTFSLTTVTFIKSVAQGSDFSTHVDGLDILMPALMRRTDTAFDPVASLGVAQLYRTRSTGSFGDTHSGTASQTSSFAVPSTSWQRPRRMLVEVMAETTTTGTRPLDEGFQPFSPISTRFFAASVGTVRLPVLVP